MSNNNNPIISSNNNSSSNNNNSNNDKSCSSNESLVICQVEGCKRELSSSKVYHRKNKVCDEHSKTPKVIVNGIEQRFCQQCSRFHLVGEFDSNKRSCRKRLAGHNERRRKHQTEINWGLQHNTNNNINSDHIMALHGTSLVDNNNDPADDVFSQSCFDHYYQEMCVKNKKMRRRKKKMRSDFDSEEEGGLFVRIRENNNNTLDLHHISSLFQRVEHQRNSAQLN